jgi:drug/metabolite transporter (DMT)-like permease
MHSIAAILDMLIGVAGWYYLFYSKAAVRLGGIEEPAINQRRQRLRRINGMVMLLLAASFYAGVFTVNIEHTPQVFAAVWLSVLVLLLVIVVLAVADLRLTSKLRGKH